MFQPRALKFIALFASLLVGSWFGFEWWRQSRVSFRLENAAGEPVENASVEFFVLDDSPSAPSPTAQLGELRDAGAEVVAGAALVPREALVRVRAAGHGVTYGHLVLGRNETSIQLGAPAEYRGRVRASGEDGAGVADARVQVLGGGPRGVLLAETTTAADGGFGVVEVSSTLTHLTFRVFAPGYAVYQEDVAIQGPSLEEFELTRTAPVRGRIAVESGEVPTGLRLRVFHVPGLTVPVADDGTFELDHLPPAPTRCTILVIGLPPGRTHRRCVVESGRRDVRIDLLPTSILTGVVVDEFTRRTVASAKIYHEHGPTGIEVVECDSDGRFELNRVPSGSVRLYADLLIARKSAAFVGGDPSKSLLQGSLEVEVPRGGRIDDIVVSIR